VTASELVEPGLFSIQPELFGCSAEELVQEMDDWRARSVAT
jgi:hypothetical protein